MRDLDGNITSLGNRITSLETDKTTKDRRLAKIEDKPYALQCAYKNGLTAANTVITWNRFITSTMSGVTGGFSLSTGEFTVGHSGVWEVNFAMKSKFAMLSTNDSEEQILAYLYINGSPLTEFKYLTYYKRSKGEVGSLGSRTLFIKLNKGDKVTLQTTTVTGDALYENTLCFHLAQPL